MVFKETIELRPSARMNQRRVSALTAFLAFFVFVASAHLDNALVFNAAVQLFEVLVFGICAWINIWLRTIACLRANFTSHTEVTIPRGASTGN